jgi:hypothetical protein
VALVALAKDVWVIVGLEAVPKGPETVSGEVAPSARVGTLMGTTLVIEDNAPDVSKFNVPDPTVVVVPVPPVISDEGTEAV